MSAVSATSVQRTSRYPSASASVMLLQKVMRGHELLVQARVQVAFVSGGRARPIPKPLRTAMKADQESGGAS